MCTKFSIYNTTIDQDISQSLVFYFIVDTVYMYKHDLVERAVSAACTEHVLIARERLAIADYSRFE